MNITQNTVEHHSPAVPQIQSVKLTVSPFNVSDEISIEIIQGQPIELVEGLNLSDSLLYTAMKNKGSFSFSPLQVEKFLELEQRVAEAVVLEIERKEEFISIIPVNYDGTGSRWFDSLTETSEANPWDIQKMVQDDIQSILTIKKENKLDKFDSVNIVNETENIPSLPEGYDDLRKMGDIDNIGILTK